MTENKDPRHQELIEWLRSQGHNDQQIELILAKVEDYDNQTMHESIFDSIDNGAFDIAALIDEALEEESASDETHSEEKKTDET